MDTSLMEPNQICPSWGGGVYMQTADGRPAVLAVLSDTGRHGKQRRTVRSTESEQSDKLITERTMSGRRLWDVQI